MPVRKISMAHINVSREAARDLISIRDYIRDELSNPSAAARIIKELKKVSCLLPIFPAAVSLWTRCWQCIPSIDTSYVSIVVYFTLPMPKAFSLSAFLIKGKIA